MNHIPDHIKELIGRSLDGVISSAEKEILDEWFFKQSDDEISPVSDEAEVYERVKCRLGAYVLEEKEEKYRIRRIRRIFAAAVVVLLGSSFLLYYIAASGREERIATSGVAKPVVANSLKPGYDRATLTLTDGTTIVLDSTEQGQFGTQGSTPFIRLGDGSLKYLKNNSRLKHSEPEYNTVSTPRGGQYMVILSDGTKVWLNASSSIRFPVPFLANLREVEITGEVYFEVAHDVTSRFLVKAKEMVVEVLGTQFNIMAYEDEVVAKTTLLQGSLTINNGGETELLRPGQQALVGKNRKMQIVKNADTEEAVAWKNGKFIFNNAGIKDVMRKVERWYDTDVVFERDGNLHFTGQLSRYTDVTELLRKLELTNEVHFRIEKGKITVLP